MWNNRITRWVPLLTVVICGLLITSVISAQPYAPQDKGSQPGPMMQQGPFNPGQGPHPGAPGRDIIFKLIGPGGPFADADIQELLSEIKILSVINMLEFTDDQLKQISKLSDDARKQMGKAIKEVRSLIIDRLEERRDALLKGEKPEGMRGGERPEIPEDMKELGQDTKDAMEDIIDAFFELLTEEQKTKLNQFGGQRFGPGQMGPGQFGPGGKHRGGDGIQPRFGGGGDRPGFRSEQLEEGTEAIDKPGLPEGRELTPEPLQNRPRGNFQDKQSWGQYSGGPRPGMQEPFGPPQMDQGMMMKMKVLEFLLNPRTTDVISKKLRAF